MAEQKRYNKDSSYDDKSKKHSRKQKRKICYFCSEQKIIDYKDVPTLNKFITEKGKILPRRMNGTCALHQRRITQAIKRARHMALIPFKGE